MDAKKGTQIRVRYHMADEYRPAVITRVTRNYVWWQYTDKMGGDAQWSRAQFNRAQSPNVIAEGRQPQSQPTPDN